MILAASETCDMAKVEVIVNGRYSDACRAIGEADLATILVAEQRGNEIVAAARANSEPHGGYRDRDKLMRGRRVRLQQQAQQRAQQGNRAATFRL